MYYLATLNLLLGLAGIGLIIATVVLLVDYFVFNGKYLADRITPFLWPVIMLMTLGSIALSLLYSEYFGFIPCSLCWLQRIAIYPQGLLSVMAWKFKDNLFFPMYGIALSGFGLLVAVYQYIYQMVPKEVLEGGALPCLTDGSGADCAEKVIDVFGFMTFPLLSAITFAFLIMLYLYMLREYKRDRTATMQTAYNEAKV